METARIERQAGGLGLTLPRDTLARLGLSDGDEVYLSETEDGFEVSIYDPETREQLRHARSVMDKRRAVLRELAK